MIDYFKEIKKHLDRQARITREEIKDATNEDELMVILTRLNQMVETLKSIQKVK